MQLEKRAAAANSRLVPVAVDFDASKIELLDLDGAAYSEPFFHETMERRLRERPRVRTRAVDFATFVDESQVYRKSPDGFIFHVGRCGSTLLANMLSSSGEHLLLKEPPLVSDLIARWLQAGDSPERHPLEKLISAALRCLAGTAGTEQYKVLKFAAWNVRMAETLLRLFPETPAVFVYRPPAETVASLFFQRPAWFDLIECPRSIQACFYPTISEAPDAARVSPASLFAHAWRSAVESALPLPLERTLLIEYRKLARSPEDVIQRVFSHLDYSVNPDRIAEIAAAGATYAKDPRGQTKFDPGGAHRRPPLSPADEAEVEMITGDTWERLQAQRVRQEEDFPAWASSR